MTHKDRRRALDMYREGHRVKYIWRQTGVPPYVTYYMARLAGCVRERKSKTPSESIVNAFLPLPRVRKRIPREHKRSAVLLSDKLGVGAAAYLYQVSPDTVYNWRYQLDPEPSHKRLLKAA